MRARIDEGDVVIRTLLFVLAALALSSPAQADNLAATYGKALLQCYASDGDKLASVGRTAEACMSREEGGDTTLGSVRCLSAETEIWDDKLNEEYKVTRAFYAGMDTSDGGQRVDALLKAQRAWIAFRDAECAMEYSAWGTGSIRSIAGADCLLSLTAERTVRLIDLRELME